MKKGDRVALYMPASPLLAASMLACARIGAIHRYMYYGCMFERMCVYAIHIYMYRYCNGTVCISLCLPITYCNCNATCTCIFCVYSVVFAGFSAEALKSRILDGKHCSELRVL